MNQAPPNATVTPIGIELRQKSKTLHVQFADQAAFDLDFEYLRVYSPSAEVKGHGPGQETLQTGKRDVQIMTLEAVGQYALKPTFSDGHDSGLYTWAYLRELGETREAKWADYLSRLGAAAASREHESVAPKHARSGCA
jgi:DUF971 family protein